MEKSKTKQKNKLLPILAVALVALVVGVALLVTQCIGGGNPASMSSGELAQALAKEGDATIRLDGDVVLEGTVTVNGNKTLTGNGTIILGTALGDQWPEEEKPSWGMGCSKLEAQQASAMASALVVSKGFTLTLSESVIIDASGNANGILVESGAKLTVSGEAGVKNGRYANLVVAEGAEATVAGGSLLDGKIYNVINYGKLDISGGTVSGAKSGAVVYTTGAMTQSGGTVSQSGLHNVYVAAGTMTMTGGTNEGAAKDGIVVAKGASAEVTGGDITNCIHGLCNYGDLKAGAVELAECGIMNNEGANLDIKGTSVDTSEVYCLANNGGKVYAEDFTASKCDTCTVYNFSGDMEFKNLTISGSRDGNIANAGGNLTINGATLGVCRDKSVTVGNGKAVLNDVTIEGTDREKYGVYTFGGELYLNNCSIKDVSSTAVKADAGSYVELNSVTIKDVAQNGFQSDGGRIVGKDVSMTNMGSHGIYNNGGDITVEGLTIDTVKKNGVQHKYGTTTISDVTAKDMGNHGAYVQEGTLTVKDAAFTTMAANGFYIVAKENKLVLDNVAITGAVQQGINSSSVVEVTNVTISKTGKNGIYNKVGGTMTINGLKVTDVTGHGVNNKATMTAANVTVVNSGADSNGIQNNGTLALKGVSITNSKNHGIYNNGKLTAEAVTINATGVNGVYNDKGEATITGLTVTKAGGQGVNNNATIALSDVKISETGKNGIYNSDGTAKVEKLTVSATTEHGVNNAAVMELTDVDIKATGEGKNGLQNSGTLTVKTLSVSDSKNHGIYNNGKLAAEAVTINTTADNGVYNDKGEATITGLTVTKAGGQGVNNNATIILSDVKISETGKNGIYNSDGTAKVEKLTVSATTEHGVNNAAVMELIDVDIKATGEGKNGLQNSGNLTVKTLSVSDSKNHGIYNNGKLTAEAVIINATGDNGVYNDKGEATITGLTVTKAGGQGVNNNATIVLSDVKINETGKNGIYNPEGTAKVDKLTVSATAEHGVNNAAVMELTNAEIKATGADKNGIQNSGDMTVKALSVADSKNHGIYNNGKLSGADVTVTGAAKNGVYNDGGTVGSLTKLSVSGVGEQGINNTGSFTASDVKVEKTGNNGVYNNGGTATISNLTVTTPGEHGVSNKGTVTLTDVTLIGSADGSNCIQNNGTMTLENALVTDSKNHGIYNDSTLVTKGELTVTGAKVNGIYNYNGNVTIEKATITTCGEHGINNAGTFNGKNLTIKSVTQNGIQNSGEINVEKASVIDSGKHGIYNGDTFYGESITVTNAGDLLLSNGGEMMKITGITLGGKANKAIYNSGYAELYSLTVDGTDVISITVDDQDNESLASNQYLVDNNGGVLDLTDATILNAFGTAVHSRGKAATSVTNVIIDHVGNFGFFVEGGSVLSGDGLVVNNVYKNAQLTGAEGIAIKLAGKITMMDHVTLGAYADDITGSGVELDKSESGLVSTALQLDAADASYSGYDLVIRNAKNGNGIYNKGILYVTDLDIDGAKDGLVCRYTGWATLSGKVKITNTTRCPVSIYGPEGNSVNINGVTLTSGADMLIDTAGQHGINNKGSFLAAADTSLTIKNIIGQNVNAINNQSGAAMSLGDATIDGVYVTVSMYNDTTINSNSGNGLQTNSTLELNGDLVIRNIYIKAANNKTDNSNGSGVVVKNSGSITGTGSITVEGSQTAPEGYDGYTGLFNGIFTTKCTIDIDGDIRVSNAKNQGIYVADANAKVEANNITVTDTAGNGNGIYINNTSGSMTAAGNITISNSGSRGIQTYGNITAGGDITVTGSKGDNGIYVRHNCKIKAANITVKQSTGNGIRIAHTNGAIEVTGKIIVEDSMNHGIFNSHGGDISAKDMEIKNVQNGYNGLQNGGGGNVILTGNLTIDGVSGTHTGENCYGNGVYFKNGKLQVSGNVIITNVTATSTHADDAHTVNNGLYADSDATVTIGGDLTVKNVKTHAVCNKGTMSVTGKIDTDTSGKRGINNSKQLVAGNVSIKGAGENGIQNSGTLIVGSVNGNDEPQLTGTLSLQNCTGHGFYNSNSGTLMAGSISIDQTKKNGINNAGTLTVAGALAVSNTKNDGIGNSGTLTAGSITVTDMTGTDGNAVKNSGTMTLGGLTISNINTTITKDEQGNGLLNKGTLNLNGDVSISNITTPGNTNDSKCHGIYNVGGTITSDKAITITVDTAMRSGIFMSGGSITGSQINLVVKNTEKTMIYMKGATVDVLSIAVHTGKDQGIRLDDTNTLKAQVAAANKVAQNGLWLRNANSNPTVEIANLICMNCDNFALTANNSIGASNVTIGTLYHQSCKNVMKNTITDGVTATVDLSTLSAEQTAALAAQLPESVRNTLFPTSTSSEEALASSEENGN